MKRFSPMMLALWLGLVLPLPALALPTLQIGIWDAAAGAYVENYDELTETSVATGSEFTLRLLLCGTPEELEEQYFISAALVTEGYEEIENTDMDLGSFQIGDLTYDVTEDMIYGTPPQNVIAKQYDLQSHSIFPTFYTEYSFYFNELDTTAGYDVQDGEFTGDGTVVYYVDIPVDLSSIEEGYTLHFDLYDEEVKITAKYNGYVVGDFAPFSHDAEGGPPVPEPSTLLLLGTGASLLAGFRRSRKR